jgi:GNAT superfamily N-acetyltransferase
MARMTALVRPLREDELAAADRIFRVAFGTFLGLPDPASCFGDADYVHTRFRAAPELALAAELDGQLVGSTFVADWGSLGFFGPLTVEPTLWDQGVAKRLLDGVMSLFEQLGTSQRGLFTFPQSPKHVGLYQKYGFWPQQLTALVEKSVDARIAPPRARSFSSLTSAEKAEQLVAMGELTGAIFAGLDVTREVLAVDRQDLGETILVGDDAGLAAVAVCHCGSGTEAGGGALYMKFGAARPGAGAAARFELLLDACEALAAARGLDRLVAGASAARHEAYRAILARGFRAFTNGVIMQSPYEAGTHRPGVFVIDDWR